MGQGLSIDVNHRQEGRPPFPQAWGFQYGQQGPPLQPNYGQQGPPLQPNYGQQGPPLQPNYGQGPPLQPQYMQAPPQQQQQQAGYSNQGWPPMNQPPPQQYPQQGWPDPTQFPPQPPAPSTSPSGIIPAFVLPGQRVATRTTLGQGSGQGGSNQDNQGWDSGPGTGLVAKAAPYTRVCNICGENAYLREGICFNHQCQATRAV